MGGARMRKALRSDKSKPAKKMEKPFKVVLLTEGGRKRTKTFSSDDDAVTYLKATRLSEAPLSFRYSDGDTVETARVEGILKRVLSE